MPNVQVDYSYKDTLFNTTILSVTNPDDHTEVQREFDEYVNRTYLSDDLPADEKPEDFVIEGVMLDNKNV